MNTKSIDLLNIGLIAIALTISFFFPFELFLFSYAVLGPLHYLTEITWLHKRNYFTTGKNDFVWLCILSGLVSLFALLFTEYQLWAILFTYLAFVIALSAVIFKSWWKKILAAVAGFFIGYSIHHFPAFFFVFAIFLPTIIHVFLFTALFMTAGALKSKSVAGGVAVLLFVSGGIMCFVFKPEFSWYSINDYTMKSFIKSGFDELGRAIIYILNLGKTDRETLFGTATGVGVVRFIAFAYTYHYLNWFSKTSVIKWHEVPRVWLISVVMVWILSVGLYAYDYRVGLIALYFLSILHVFLEFPLNFRSMADIATHIRRAVPNIRRQGIS
ncbi:MAG: hypothetical protein RMJ53_04340 [Chitinophagales bacterium]|nr:hypothetical protein [Chitinophagales bacterium]MDW8273442.1 hypothetical protein [Chitinophagales bacterium]